VEFITQQRVLPGLVTAGFKTDNDLEIWKSLARSRGVVSQVHIPTVFWSD
jgi:hypothetical protein